MSPDQFLRQIEKQPPKPVYLFLGPEAYMRRACRQALVERVLPPEERESGLTRHDLDEAPLAALLDDARSFSLFASRRLMWIAGAEAALPKRLTAEEGPGAAALASYVRDPTPGTVLVFDVLRYDFDGDDKPKIERVQKFYSCVPDQVEFRPFTQEASRSLARDLAKRGNLEIGTSELGLLVDSLGGDASRIAIEIEKLALFAGPGRKITAADIASLVPNAQAGNLFTLVAALGRGDRQRSLEALDTLLREGEYLPLALAFLGTQFRMALAAHEAGQRNAQQIEGYFRKLGIRIWRDRAEQVAQTVAAFSVPRLKRAIERVSHADIALRDARPDDRVVMEEFVFSLTGGPRN